MKSNLKTKPLFHTIRALLQDFQPSEATVGYHSNPNNPRAFSYDKSLGFRVPYDKNDYYVLLNYTSNLENFEVLLGHSRGRNCSGNTADISFTEANFGPHFLLVVTPSLKRCNGDLEIEPSRMDDFPARVVGTKNRFLVGFLDTLLFPRLFCLCLAKKISIEMLSSSSVV